MSEMLGAALSGPRRFVAEPTGYTPERGAAVWWVRDTLMGVGFSPGPRAQAEAAADEAERAERGNAAARERRAQRGRESQ